MNSWSLFKKGRPAWLTSLPQRESPGVFAFLVAMARAQVLTFGTLLLLFPFFRMQHPGGFEFNLWEGFFFALLYIVFEEHARWNFVVNAARPFVVATKFAILISLLELALFQLSSGADMRFPDLAAGRIPATVLHFVLGYLAASCARRRTRVMLGAFLVGLLLHAVFNFLGPGAWITAVVNAG